MNKESTYSINQLFNLIAKDNQHAFDKVFELYQSKVFGIAIKVLKDQIFAEEVTQEVFIGLWTNRKKLEHILTPDAYLFRVTKNKCIDYLRKITTDKKNISIIWENLNAPIQIEPDIDLNEIKNKLQSAIQQLPTKRKEIFILSRVFEMDYATIASKSGISINTVKTHIKLALKDLRSSLLQKQIIFIGLIQILFA